jgi:hypothetical protein
MEIVIVDSYRKLEKCPVEIRSLCAIFGIKLIYEFRNCALPGAARNIGLGVSTCNLIAFIDVQTIPRPMWLEESLNLLKDDQIYGVWGATAFSAQTKFEGLVRDGFYGVLARKTLPGSVFRREIFSKSGEFIDWVRAGEDTEWMLRVQILKMQIAHTTIVLVDYVGLIGTDRKQLVKKWYRNYSAARELPHFFPQKLFLWLFIYPLIVLIAFNWNYLLADWQMDSPLYIGHITKLVAILPIIIYITVRGIVLPLKRGVDIWNLLPFRFFSIISVCFMADLVKILVFTFPNRKYFTIQYLN